MSITAAELTQYGRSSIDLYMKNNPIDSVNPERPLLKKLMEKKKETPAGKQYKIYQVRKGNDSNFQDFYGSEQVNYNRKDTLEQSQHEYNNFHDGFSLHEDDFIRNGVEIKDGPGKQATGSEKTTITNLFDENNETLREGFEESLDVCLHVSQGVNASALVSNITSSPLLGLGDMVPYSASGSYAGISRTNGYWQNYYASDLSTGSSGNILTRMRAAWRSATKYGGRPDFILCGSTFLDAYIDHMLTQYGRVNYTPTGTKGIEGAEDGVYYNKVPLIWDPTFDTLSDNTIDNTVDWKKRCYFLNTRFLGLEPIKGQWMVSRTPPRVYNKYEYYWGLTARTYLTNKRPTAHAAMALA